MNIQSLSIDVPGAQCVNHCETCPSRMHESDYPNMLRIDEMRFGYYMREYVKRLDFARDNGCNTMMITGTIEPQQNRDFLIKLGMMKAMMRKPFHNVEMQCTGLFLDPSYLRQLQEHLGLNTLALSLFSLDEDENEEIIHPPKEINVYDVAEKAHYTMGMTVRACLNLTKHFDKFADNPKSMFDHVRDNFGAQQCTLRVLWCNEEDDSPEARFVKANKADNSTVHALRRYVEHNGTILGKLPFGAVKYSVDGLCVVMDGDSMAKAVPAAEDYKYLILRPDCKLYSSWDDPASIIF